MEIKSWINYGPFVLLIALLSLAAAAEPSNLTTFDKDGKVPFSDVKIDTDGNGQVDSWVVSNIQTVLNAHFEKGKIDHFIFRSSINKKNYLVGYFNIKMKRLFVWRSLGKVLGLEKQSTNLYENQEPDKCESKPVSEVIEDLAAATGAMQGSGDLVVSCFDKPEFNKSMTVFANDGLEAIRGCAARVMPQLKSGLDDDHSIAGTAYTNTLKYLESSSGAEALFECAPTQVGKKAEFVENGGFFKIRLHIGQKWNEKKDQSPVFVHEYFHAIVNTARNMKSCKAESVEQVSASCLNPQTEKAKKAEEELVSKLTEICLNVSHKFIPDSVAESVAQTEPPNPVPPPLEVLSPPPIPQEINQVSNHTYLPAEQVMAREMPRGYAALAEERARPLFDWVDRATETVRKQVKGNWGVLPSADASDIKGNYKAPKGMASSGPTVAAISDSTSGSSVASSQAGSSAQKKNETASASDSREAQNTKVATAASGTKSQSGQLTSRRKAGGGASVSVATGLSTEPDQNANKVDEEPSLADRAPSSISPELISPKTVESLVTKGSGGEILKAIYPTSNPRQMNKAFVVQLKKLKYSIRDINGNHFGVLESQATQCYVLRATDEPLVNVNCISKRR